MLSRAYNKKEAVSKEINGVILDLPSASRLVSESDNSLNEYQIPKQVRDDFQHLLRQPLF